MISAVDRLVVAVAPWPLLAAGGSPRFVRLYRRRATVAVAYLVVYALVVAVAAVLFAWLLIAWAIAVSAASLYLLWRVSAGFGRRQGLPPGRLSLFPVRAVTDHGFVSKQIARHGPVSKVAMPNVARPLVLVSGLARGAAVLRAQESRLRWVGMSFDSMIPAGFIRSMGPDDHRRYIRVLRDSFADSVVEACEPAFAALARAELERLASAAAGAARERVDPRPALASYTLASFARLFLGVSPGSAELMLIERLYRDPGPLTVMWGADEEGLRQAVRDASELFRQRASQLSEQGARGGHPDPSFLGQILLDRPEAVYDPNVMLNLVFLLGTTFRDVTGLLHWIVKMLGDNPGWSDRVVEDGGSADLSSRIVLETLRLEQSEYILRKVLETFEFDGYVVPAGWYLRVCVRESHRDPAVFPDPDRFDPDRFLGKRHTRDEYSPLGMTSRPCTGVTTTVAVARALVQELARGYEWRVVRDGPAEFDGYHWRPSTRLRIGITPRVAA